MRNVDRMGLIALTILATSLPFELKNPIASVGSLSITNVEAVLYVTLLVWLVSRIITRRINWTPAHTGVAIWMLALIVTAMAAPIEREAAIKFMLRSLGGCLLFFAAADWITSPQRAQWISGALIAGTVASALSGIAEVWLPGTAAVWSAFKTQASLIGRYLRASGTFQYANTAAMYWEASLPIILMFGVWLTIGRTQKRWQWLLTALAIVVILAIVLSAGRAAFVVAALALSALIAIGQRTRSGWRRPIGMALAALIAIIIVQAATNPLLALRLQSENDADWYRAEFQPAQSSLQLEAGQAVTLTVTVRNRSVQTWQAGGAQSTALSYHWIDPVNSQMVIFDGVRTPLPHDVAPDEAIALEAYVVIPDQPGPLMLQWDMVQEGVVWFSDKTGTPGNVPVSVMPTAHPIPAAPRTNPTIRPSFPPQPSRFVLWRAGLQMFLDHPLTGLGPDNFRHRYGVYLGLDYFDDRITANNWYVETAADMGLVGISALIDLSVTFGLILRRGWKITMRLKS